MNCTECNEFKTRSVFQGKSTKDVCAEILGLFDELNIPPSEQLILLNMADKRLDCNSFKNILLALYEKYKSLDEYRAKYNGKSKINNYFCARNLML